MKPDNHAFVLLDDEEVIAAVEGAGVESDREGGSGIRRTDKIATAIVDESRGVAHSVRKIEFDVDGKLILELPEDDEYANTLIVDLAKRVRSEGLGLIIKKAEGIVVLHKNQNSTKPLSPIFLCFLDNFKRR